MGDISAQISVSADIYENIEYRISVSAGIDTDISNRYFIYIVNSDKALEMHVFWQYFTANSKNVFKKLMLISYFQSWVRKYDYFYNIF